MVQKKCTELTSIRISIASGLRRCALEEVALRISFNTGIRKLSTRSTSGATRLSNP